MSSSSERSLSPPQKRKRAEHDAEEIEIDIALPEPPSRKALRKAKKQKTGSKQEASDNAEPDQGRKVEEDANTGNEVEDDSRKAAQKQERSQYSIWIGNLPWTCDKAGLTSFLVEKSAGGLTAESIVRIHMPGPSSIPRNWVQAIKPQNKGFAYVDFDTQQALYAARALTETPFNGRNVLIKEAKDFAGRPEEHKVAKTSKVQADSKQSTTEEASDRVFVGNLGFEVTKDELQEHFQQCGEVTNVFMATFQDTGKCKGFAWVTFSEISAAQAAVRGWAWKDEEDDASDQENANPDNAHDANPEKQSRKVKAKPRRSKLFVNRLQGRTLRCEYAESSTIRYNKRFRGSGRKTESSEAAHEDGDSGAAPSNDRDTLSRHKSTGYKRDAVRKPADNATLPLNVGLPRAEGTKITFNE